MGCRPPDPGPRPVRATGWPGAGCPGAHAESPHGNRRTGTRRTIDRLGNLERLVARGHPVGKRPQLADGTQIIQARVWTEREGNTAEGLVAPLPFEGRQGLLQVLHGLTVVAQVDSRANPMARLTLTLEADIPEGGRYGGLAGCRPAPVRSPPSDEVAWLDAETCPSRR